VHCPCTQSSSKSECNELRSANTKLKDELEQLKEKYHSQLGDGVRIKREVRNFKGGVIRIQGSMASRLPQTLERIQCGDHDDNAIAINRALQSTYPTCTPCICI
jgi:DNA mismatch repair ATPase MutS